MTNTHKKWSSAEVDTLVSILRNTPENLTQGFREFSQMSGKSFRSVSLKYYTDIKKKHPLFQLGHQKRNFNNTKNIATPKSKETKEENGELKEEYISMIRSLFKKFTETERVQILKSLL